MKQEIFDRLNEVIEAELTKIYNENDIMTGNIEPLQSLQWDDLINGMTDLFIELINQNN